MKIVVVERDGKIIERIALTEGIEILIGRSPESDVVVDDPSVSRKHAVVRMRSGEVYVEDLGSSNGTEIDGLSIRGREVPALRWRIGTYNFSVITSEKEIKKEGSGEFSSSELFYRVADNYYRKTLELMRKKQVEGEEEVAETLRHMIEEDGVAEEYGLDEGEIVRYVLDEIFHYGVITPLLEDETVTEVMVNGPEKIYFERGGKLYRYEKRFSNEESVRRIIEKVVSSVGRRIDESVPYVDARLPDGSRFNAVIPPIAIDGPSITIRKFFKKKLTIDDLIRFGSLTPEIARYLSLAVKYRKNILVSGGTGTGKTTLLNIISSFIPPDERIITIEDAAELQLPQEHVVRLEARPPNIEGKGTVTIRDLVRNALRMRPDRIIVGECRGGEALDMLQAMNTGHDGSLTTIHANSPRDAISRLETMVMMAGMELPHLAIIKQIASAIDVIVQLTRFSDGSRKVTAVVEVEGLEGDTIILREIYRFVRKGRDSEGRITGEFVSTQFTPLLYEELREMGEL